MLGFEVNNFSCMKFKVSTEIPYMIERQEYPVSALKTSESKEEIDFSEYYMLKDKVENPLEWWGHFSSRCVLGRLYFYL